MFHLNPNPVIHVLSVLLDLLVFVDLKENQVVLVFLVNQVILVFLDVLESLGVSVILENPVLLENLEILDSRVLLVMTLLVVLESKVLLVPLVLVVLKVFPDLMDKPQQILVLLVPSAPLVLLDLLEEEDLLAPLDLLDNLENPENLVDTALHLVESKKSSLLLSLNSTLEDGDLAPLMNNILDIVIKTF